MLLAEELLLLLLDDESGKMPASLVGLDKGLAGAVLIELTLRGAVDVTGDKGSARSGRIVLGTVKPPEHPILREALSTLREFEGKKPARVLGPLGRGLRDRLGDSLVQAGVLEREEHRVLGLIPTKRLPAKNSSHENELRTQLTAVLAGGEPDERTGPLLALLSALDAVTKVLDVPDKRAAKKRAKELGQGDWAAEAVRQAVAAIHASIIAAATSSAASGSS